MAGRFLTQLPRLALLALLLALPLTAQAQRVALLPMADFSRGSNGINLPFTDQVVQSLERLGIDMVPLDQVLPFMAENRLRSFSYLDSFLAKKLGKELNCAVVLFGTITEIGGRPPALGLIFTALDTVSGQPVWSETGATSVFEESTLLAIGQPAQVADLADPLLDRLLQRLEDKVTADAIPDERSYQLTGLQLFPAYVRGRQQIDATLKISFLNAQPTALALESSAGRTPLRLDPKTGIYHGAWFAPEQDGQYRLDLLLEWGASRVAERIEQVASYQVINQPPGLRMEIRKGQQIGATLAFRDHILVLPRLQDLKPMARWALEIRNHEGVELVNQEYEGDIPERMVWEGHGSDGFHLANGKYQITLRVWDLAGNSSSDSRTVVMQRNAPHLFASVVRQRGKTLLKIDADSVPAFPLTAWDVELRSKQGKVLLKQQGEQLPQLLEFTPEGDEKTVFFSVSGEDQLGNRLAPPRKELAIPEDKPGEREQKVDSWVQDF